MSHAPQILAPRTSGSSLPLPVPLTTVRSPMHEMGYRGLNLLVGLMRGEPVESERLRPELVIRCSTAPRGARSRA